jgi:geranylgeranyl diphosphate synthase, type I
MPQLGWWDAGGTPTNAGGQALRPALVLLCAIAAGGSAQDAVPATLAAADELMSLAFEGFFRRSANAEVACAAATALGEAVARTARGQALDLAFEHTDAVTIEQRLSLEADKTASLLAVATRLGALYGGATGEAADRAASAELAALASFAVSRAFRGPGA